MNDTVLLLDPALSSSSARSWCAAAPPTGMYKSLADWLTPLPGGLLHTNIGASALFSAVSGSSVATAATIATVALPTFKGRNYDQRMVLGTIAAGASLGNLIPPGIALIIYGAMTNTSVGRLYAGARHARRDPDRDVHGDDRDHGAAAADDRAARGRAPSPLLDRIRRAPGRPAAPLFIFVVIMGSIYTGWATPTESAALAVVLSLPIAAIYGKLSIGMLHECFVATVVLTAMSILILAGGLLPELRAGPARRDAGADSTFVAGLRRSPLQLIFVLLGLLPDPRRVLRDAAHDGRHRADRLPAGHRGRGRSRSGSASSSC